MVPHMYACACKTLSRPATRLIEGMSIASMHRMTALCGLTPQKFDLRTCCACAVQHVKHKYELPGPRGAIPERRCAAQLRAVAVACCKPKRDKATVDKAAPTSTSQQQLAASYCMHGRGPQKNVATRRCVSTARRISHVPCGTARHGTVRVMSRHSTARVMYAPCAVQYLAAKIYIWK